MVTIAPEGPLRSPVRRPFLRRRSAVPGFALTLGLTITILSLVVLIPLTAVVIKSAELSPAEFVAAAFSERAMQAYKLSFGASLIAAAINGVFGVLTAWALVRYDFPGKAVVGARSTCPSPYRRRWPASPSPPSTPRTAGSAGCWLRSGSRRPTIRPAWSSP